MLRAVPKILSILAALLVVVAQAAAQDEALRSIEFETTEVTQASITVSPDGELLIFTMLGHLFQLPVAGGIAMQLTFGSHYDADPTFSPDGERVAFVSDRDGSEGNVFLLELETGEITQLTHENWVGRPAWSSDGETIAFLSYVRGSEGTTQVTHATGFVHVIALGDERSRIVTSEAAMVSSVFYLPDRRLAWSVFEGRSPGAIWSGFSPVPDAVTRIQVIDEQGSVSTLREIQGIAHRLVASPAGDGFYARHLPTPRAGGFMPEEEELLFVPVTGGPVSHLGSVSGTSGWDWGPRFAVSRDGGTLYLGEGGGLRQILLSDKTERMTQFTAQVRLEINTPTPPLPAVFADPGSSLPPRILHVPTVSPDGQHLIFGAAGFIWVQRLGGGAAEIVYKSDGFAWNGTMSPDNLHLALLEARHGTKSVKVLDMQSGITRTLVSGESWPWQLNWSPDGRRLIFVDTSEQQVVVVDASDGSVQWVTPIRGSVWGVRPMFSPDGQAIYFSDEDTLFRLPLGEGAALAPLTTLTDEFTDALVSEDEHWLVFRRGRGIWVAPLTSVPVTESDVSRLSDLGGEGFSLLPGTPDVLYAVGHQVWYRSVVGGELEEIPLRADILRPVPPTVLIRDVRILDFDAGEFGPEISLLIERGRIHWMGSESDRQLSDDVVTIDGTGRYAIPGFFDFHVHSGFSANASFIAYGVTSLRDLGRGLAWVGASADRADATPEPIPRYFYAGYTLGGAPNGVSENDARVSVRELSMSGVSLIKNYATMSWPLQSARAEEARRLGIPVAAHGMNIKEITKGVTLGYASLEHSGFRVYEDVLEMLALSGTHWDPTIGSTLCYCLPFQEESEIAGYEKLLEHFPDADKLIEDSGPIREWTLAMLPGVFAQQLEGVRTAYSRGVQLHVGTDSPDNHHLAFPGLSMHWELGFLARAGIPPLEVIRIATRDAAEAVGAGDDLGTLEVGKLADIVLLDANPLEDISNTQSIWRVIKGGWVFDPEELGAIQAKESSLTH
jgi:imidazolonepropionase-like amidohydrolase/Tol biopolymer transport system component